MYKERMVADKKRIKAEINKRNRDREITRF